MKKALLFICLLLALALPVHAATIGTLYNTGVDASGTPVPGPDSHYTISKVDYAGPYGGTWDPNGPPATVFNYSSTTAVPTVVQTPTGVWTPNTSTTNWISLDPSGTLGYSLYNIGLYFYQTTFDLTGLDPNSVQITGIWGTDDVGWMYLNLADPNVPALSNLVSAGAGFMTDWRVPFTISGANGLFHPGVNTLTFAVWDAGGAVTGLWVDFQTKTANPIPEPGTMMLLGSGLVGLVGYGSRRLKK